MSTDVVAEFRDDLLKWSHGRLRDFRWRNSEAGFYEVMMAEFFLARTRAEVVARVLPEFLDEYPALESLREAGQDEIAEVIRPTGLQNRRSKALKELAEAVEGDTLPRSRDQLLELPRVGEYVANATLCFAHGEPYYIRDTNVLRIFQRLLGDEWPQNKDRQAELLSDSVPEDEPRRYNLALLDFGAKICTSQSPNCSDCFASAYCSYYAEGQMKE